jgi:predicted ribosome quality control (RQC) complex YloA/Tae2 family protein
MAFDACMMRAVLSEFSSEFSEAKIEKILQPVSDEIDVVIHQGKVSRRLLFNVGPNAPRLQLTDVAKENPQSAPMFCMFLRKRLGGARIISVNQPGFDRIACFTVQGYDEMGYPTRMKIVCEIMGKYANLILLDEEDKIISALKIIDFAASTVRQVLPGLRYTPPAMAEKLLPTEIERESFVRAVSAFGTERSIVKFITSTYSGVATQIARELAFRAAGDSDALMREVDTERLFSVLSEWCELLREQRYEPTVAIDKSGKPVDYSYMRITYLGDAVSCASFSTFRELFDLYFAEKDRIEKVSQRSKDIKNLLSAAIARTERKLSIQRASLEESERAEEYKRRADLITANIYRIPRGAASVTVTDYYDDDCPEIQIPLDTRISAAANAQRAYKQYNKFKTAKAVLTEQIEIWERELEYLLSVSEFLSRAELEQDIADIRDELYRSGYASRMRGYKPPKQQLSKPLSFTTTSGKRVLVGKNNTQNDRVTFKMSEKWDVWFHVKDMPGSHVLLITEGEEPTDLDYTEAAELAAGYSSATADLVAVDYTRVKNVKKPSGAKPGYVIYKTNYTAYVRPKRSIARENG